MPEYLDGEPPEGLKVDQLSMDNQESEDPDITRQ